MLTTSEADSKILIKRRYKQMKSPPSAVSHFIIIEIA